MKRIKHISMILLTCLLLAACASQPEPELQEKTQLELWHYWELSYARQALRQAANRFQEENPDIEIHIRYVPDEDLKKQLALSMADGTMPDIAIVDSSDVQYFARTGYLEDVSDLVDEGAYLEPVIASCKTADGGLSGVPLGGNCLLFFYNKDQMDAAGIEPPQTLDAFVAAARRLTGDGVYGCAFPALQSEESLFCFLPILWAKGGSLQALDSQTSQAAFDVLRQLATSGAMSQETVNMTLGDVEREFKKGRVAMMFSTSMAIQSVQREDLGFEVGIASLPLAPDQLSVIGGEVMTVTNGAHKEEARRFLQYIAEPEQIRQYIDAMGYLAPRHDVLEWQLQQKPELEQGVAIMETARTREFGPAWPQISFAVAETISKVILREDTPETFEELADRVQAIREEKE